MLKKYVIVVLAILMINLSLGLTTFAKTNDSKSAKHTEKVKAKITKLGTGKDARIKIKLKDGTKLKGYVSEINESTFVVTDEKTGATTEVPYPNAKQVKGNNLSKGVKIAIGIGIILAAVALICIASPDCRS